MNAANGGRGVEPALADFIRLNEEIAAVVRAGLPLEPHLARIGAELPTKAGELAERIASRLSGGDDLASAIETECASMPAIYRATMMAGTASGNPGKAIEMLVDSATRLDQIRRVTGAALVYPLIVVTLTSALFAFVVLFVAPTFSWLNESHFGPLARLADWPTAVVVAAIAAPLAIVSAALFWWWRTRKTGGTLATRFGLLAWLPGARRVCRWTNAAAFAELLLLLVENNVPLDQALRLAGGAAGDASFRDAAEQLAARAERGEQVAGAALGQSVATASSFPLLVRLALRHSTNRELFTSSLRQAAGLYRDRALRSAQWYSEYAPILLTVAIGGTLTLGFTLLVLWPYVSTLREIAGSNWG
jgi:type IV pilus assembly protein PilC